MTPLGWVMGAALAICAFALALTLVNLARYRRPAGLAGPVPDLGRTLVSVCIPARNEAHNIEVCVSSAIAASDGVRVEVLVYDDQSTDGTGGILASLAQADARVRTVPTRPLPHGWVGKQWACDQLGRAAKGDWVLFTDADVRFSPGCVGASVCEAQRLGADLISTFPRQVTGTLGEALLVPLIHFLLLSYLPMGRMRRTADPSASAGCGQFLLARREAYLASGGHGAFPGTMHDGIKMPRAFRRAGFRTDLFDATALVECRMYRGLAQTWRGFAKNAYEGLGSAVLLVFLTVLHLVGHVLPWVVILGSFTVAEWRGVVLWLALASAATALAHRLILARRFSQPVVGAVLHPVGILAMTLVQWHSYALWLTGRRDWRGRRALEPDAPRLGPSAG